jgi:hypothetical protein
VQGGGGFSNPVLLLSKLNDDCAGEVWEYGLIMDWQQIDALGMVAGTAGLLLSGKWRRRKFNFQRDTMCGCTANGRSPTKGSIVFHARKGGMSEVVVKMR